MRDLIILGTRRDPHNKWIEDELRDMGIERVFVLDFDDSKFSVVVGGNGETSFHIDGNSIKSDFVVWDRAVVKEGTPFYLPTTGDEGVEVRTFMAEEWRSFYRLISCLAGEVLNPLLSRICLAKIHQQQLAAAAGFKVPESIITNDLQFAKDFNSKLGSSLVMKALSSSRVRIDPGNDTRHYTVMTMRTDFDNLAGTSDSEFIICPHFLQQEISKSFELRVVWINGETFAFRVNSQQYKSSEVDWRRLSDVLIFEEYSLPLALEKRISLVMKSLNLFSGSLDLIVDTSDNVWFLECNSEGAWGWLDEISGNKLRQSFARNIVDRLKMKR